MTPAELLDLLSERQVHVQLDGARLRYRSPKGALTPELQEQLAAHKDAVRDLLRERGAASVETSPLSYAQRSLWFLHSNDPETAAYHTVFCIHITSPLDADLLEQAYQVLVDRHATLRTTYAMLDGDVRQRVHGSVTVAFERHLAPGETLDQVRQRAIEHYRQPFDLEHGPVIRVQLFQLGPDDHVLLQTIHHVAVDGWSILLLAEELERVYGALAEGRPVPPPQAGAAYVDHVRWQQEMLAGPEGERLWRSWREQLRGPLPVLDLPTDRPRPPALTSNGATESLTLEPRLARQVVELAKAERSTLFVLLLSTFYVLLHRYSGQDDLIVGTPSFGRDRAEFTNVVGAFINTLPLRADLSGSPTFRELLARVRASVLGGIAHQDYPFSLLVERLRPPRDPSRLPVLQTMINLQKFDRFKGVIGSIITGKVDEHARFGGMQVEPVYIPQQEGQFDLNLEINELGDELICALRYNTDLFDRATAARLLAHYERLLESVVAAPGSAIAELELMRSSELETLAEWNASALEYDRDATLASLVTAQSGRTPGARAVSAGGAGMTSYAELDAASNRLAHQLRALGVGRGSRVAVAVSRTPALPVALLGVLKAGAAYVPLDPAFPAERLAFMLADAQVSAVVTEEHLRAALPAHAAPVVSLDGDAAELAAQPDTPPTAGPRPEDVAYVIYTSGSTGQPKGVQIPHRAVVNFLASMRERPGLSASDVLLSVTTLSFDISVLEIFLPLSVGAEVVLASREEAADGEALAERLATSGATVMQATPTTWRLLLESGWRGDGRLKALVGGEAWPDSMARALRECCGSVWNLYGPTETTIWSAVAEVGEGPVLIGAPVGNTTLHVLDAGLRPVPVGVPGELCIGGAGLALGYLDRPELTAERFVADPLRAGGRLYRTGDRVRRRADGQLEFLGRLDSQVKLRGYRVELGEIEAVLARHPAVAEAVALVREDVPGDARLVAYLVAAAGQAPGAGELRSHARASLPDYMVPSAYVLLDAFPLTPNRKVDRKALPAPAADLAAPAAARVAPRTEVERILAGIWAQVLGIAEPGVEDDFFELGGHSLLATQVMSRIREQLSVELPLRSLFAAPRIALLADAVTAARAEASGGAEAARHPPGPIERISRDDELPLSHAQRRLWFLDRLEPGSSSYVMPSATRIRGELDQAALNRALTEIVRRHESLRMAFPSQDGAPRVLVREPFEIEVPLTDLSALDEADREARIARAIEQNASEPFDLERGPLVRVRLLRLPADEHLLLLAFHHIVFDFWSAGVFGKELACLYEAFRENEPSPLPEPPLQYLDVVHWQQARLEAGDRERHLEYWKQRIDADRPPLDLPTDRPRPKILTTRGAQCSMRLDPRLAAAVSGFSRREGVTPAMTLLAVLQVLLHRLSGQDCVHTGMPVAGRDRPETAELIGFFINTIVVRSDLDDEIPFRVFLKQVRDALLGALEHQEMPFEELVAALEPARDLQRTPLFQVFFNHINVEAPEARLPGATIEPLTPFKVESKFELTLYALERGEDIELLLVYNAELFDEARMSMVLSQYAQLLEQVVDQPERGLSEHALAGPGPDPAAPLAADSGYAGGTLTARHIARYGKAVALAGRSGEWSYEELDRRADHLAAILLAHGVQRGDAVALYARRDPLLVCAMLAVLRAGAAFAILDDAWPDARLAENFRAAAPRGLLLIGADAEPGAELEKAAAAAGLRIRLPVTAELLGEAGASPAADYPEVGPDDLAYVAFTSGTTGGAKAIVGTHGPVAHFLEWQKDTFELRQEDRFSLLAGLAHDPLLRDVFAPLWSGGALHVPEADVIRDSLRLAKWLHDEQISVAHLTPAMAELVTMAGQTALERLRYVFFGGDVLYAGTVRKLRELARDVHCVNFYGATETPQAMSWHSLPPGCPLARERVPIGHGIDGVQLLVVNTADRMAGTGEIGEILVRTSFLTQGYRNDTALSRERFCPNPFTQSADDRVYRTGDLGRYLPDGGVEIVGRADSQVQLRGFRIELGAVDAAIARHPAVRQCATVVREDVPGDARLVAYLVAAPGQAPTTSELRRHAQASLPAFMVPSMFFTLAELPLTPNRKIDRKRLPSPYGQEDSRTVVPPRTATEKSVAGIWCELLGLQTLSVHDNFFDLGGHSLLTIRAVSRLENALGVRLNPGALIGQTLAQVAAAIDAEREPENAEGEPGSTVSRLYRRIASFLFAS